MIEILGKLIAGLICTLGVPFHLGVCALIKMNDPGPALYRSPRLGKDCVPFLLMKYRSMKVNVPPVITRDLKMVVDEQDERVTELGKFLRCGIDELPQLWNIVRGEMAWVGPRPDTEWMLPHYGPVCKQRASCIPGITGLAQVLGSRNLPTAEGFAIDLWYVAHRSIWLDAWIVFLTPLYLAGWHSLGRNRLRKIRTSSEFQEVLWRCSAELARASLQVQVAERV